MKSRSRSSAGFTLIELVVAVFICGFMVLALVTIFSTAHKHLFQNYRLNAFRSGATLAVKDISARLAEANVVDQPAANAAGNTLAFAVNVDRMGRCYPLNRGEETRWHYYCYAPGATARCPGGCLYHHTGLIAAAAAVPPESDCPSGRVWPAAYPVPICGAAGGTITLLATYVQPTPTIFSRTGNDLINVNLRVFWDPRARATALHNFAATDKPVDFTLNTTIKANCAGN
ncbi:MAG: prepilin-type N-terminal cleavage/methylation domain-containing protein [Elusimicrobiales bacterium]|jgi:Tfp pilus assembly protein PilV